MKEIIIASGETKSASIISYGDSFTYIYKTNGKENQTTFLKKDIKSITINTTTETTLEDKKPYPMLCLILFFVFLAVGIGLLIPKYYVMSVVSLVISIVVVVAGFIISNQQEELTKEEQNISFYDYRDKNVISVSVPQIDVSIFKEIEKEIRNISDLEYKEPLVVDTTKE